MSVNDVLRGLLSDYTPHDLLNRIAQLCDGTDAVATDIEADMALNAVLTDEVEIDSPPIVRRVDEGVWVNVWVWINDPEWE